MEEAKREDLFEIKTDRLGRRALTKYRGKDRAPELPEDIEVIGDYAFWCRDIVSVRIPDSVKEIGQGAFMWCDRLTEVSLPEGIRLGTDAFADAPGVPFSLCVTDGVLMGYHGVCPEELVIPAGVRSVARGLFEGQIFTRIVFPEGLTSIGRESFVHCEYLTEVVLPDSVKRIGDCAFAWCHQLTKVSLPKSARMGVYAFADAPGVPFSLNIRNDTVVGWTGDIPEEIVFPPDVKRIYCDFDTDHIRRIVLPEGLLKIYGGAFRACSNLVSAAIPDTVKEIDDLAFADCVSLTDLSVPRGAGIREGAFRNVPGAEFSLCITDGRLEDYNGVCPEMLTLPPEVEVIEDGVFSECPTLVSIVIPEGVREIGRWAFSECPTLESVVIPDSVEEIGEGAFEDCCDSLTIVTNNPVAIEYAKNHGLPWTVGRKQ
ncbi:MAG: leucine-rich repeat domain-containing protein [Abditibacteriota bacterium]|nr:leucine-rich repeat domain-containing protein [Abditibacteriota bacterium]